jgi:gas vesicle protein
MSTTRFLTGALVGLVTGMLVAPKKGEELREDIADNAGKLKKKIQKVAGKAGTELNDLRTILEDEVSGLSDDVRGRMLTMLNETQESARNLRGSM